MRAPCRKTSEQSSTVLCDVSRYSYATAHYVADLNRPLIDYIHELRGRDLVCWCAPEACHGDVLLALANEQ